MKRNRFSASIYPHTNLVPEGRKRAQNMSSLPHYPARPQPTKSLPRIQPCLCPNQELSPGDPVKGLCDGTQLTGRKQIYFINFINTR